VNRRSQGNTALRCLLIGATFVLGIALEAQLTWRIDNTNMIGGFTVTRYGGPQVIATPYGDAVWFDGVDDGLVVGTNPVANLSEFTVEVLFRPDPSTHASSTQPRFFHIQSSDPPDDRLTLETRFAGTQWYLDTFVRDNGAGLTLIDMTKRHPVGRWYHAASVVDGAPTNNYRGYVNGVLELAGTFRVTGLANGLSSIGMRANQVNYFEGAILAFRFTPRALSPAEFMGLPRTILRAPTIAGGRVDLDLDLVEGMPLGFSLLEAALPGGPWTTNTTAVFSTNVAEASYRFSLPVSEPVRFYQVRAP
jgi:hypothetical protein